MDHLQKLLNALRDNKLRHDAAVIADDFAQYQATLGGLRHDSDHDSRRFDAGETAFLSRQLLYTRQQEVTVFYTKLKAKLFIPESNEIPAAAETFTTRIWDGTGSAKIIANYATDFPTGEESVTEVIGKVKSLGIGYSYSIMDLRRAALGQVPLDAKRATRARQIHERTVDVIAAIGDTASGLTGFLNNTNVPTMTHGSGGFTGVWVLGTTSAAVIMADLNLISATVKNQSKENFLADTLLLSPEDFDCASRTPYSTLNGESVLSVWLKGEPYIKQVDQWHHLSTNGLNAGRMAVAYERSPLNAALEIPQQFETFAPQQLGLSFNVPCHSRIAGVQVYNPLSMVYAYFTG